jgi:hypothetical protein
MLWITWFKLICELRPAFSRFRTFQWFVISMVGVTARKDLAGITSIVRAIPILPRFYTRLLNNFHSDGINLEKLNSFWFSLSLKMFKNCLVKLNGRLLFVGDGIKIPKEGKKMPGVKLLHQSSQSNSKAEYIMGHSLQALSLLVMGGGSFLAIPLVCRIHEGIRLGPKDKKTLIDKFFELVRDLLGTSMAYLVADAYYCCGHLARALQSLGIDLITRVRKNAVAYIPYNGPQKGRGRPKVYGKKVKLMDLFKRLSDFKTIASPVYGEKGVQIDYLVIDLIWKSFGSLVRFCLVKHPTRGKCIFMTTDISLAAKDIIEGYGLRYKIEYSFKELVHSIGGFCYHFWMMSLDKVKRKSGDIFLHRKSLEYRGRVQKKLFTYHLHIQMGLIAQGLLQYLSVSFTEQVWGSFGGWLRTIRPGILPSVQVTQQALRSGVLEFFQVIKKRRKWKKFITKITKKPRKPDKSDVAA